MKKLISLIIDAETKINIGSKYFEKIEDVYAYSGELSVTLEHKGQVIYLSKKITLFDLEHTVLDNFKKVLHNELQVSSGIDDLGLEFNNYWFHVSQNDDSNFQRTTESFELFQCSGLQLNDTITFLYNVQGDIVFQASLKYPWFFALEEPSVSYKEWLSTYKVLYKHEISYSLIQKWIVQLEEFIFELRSRVNK